MKTPRDPFGFQSEINWDAVDALTREQLDRLLEQDAEEHEALYGEDVRR